MAKKKEVATKTPTKKRKPRASVAEMVKREELKIAKLKARKKLIEKRQEVAEMKEELGL